MIINRISVLDLWTKCKVRSENVAQMNHQAQLAVSYKKEFYDPAADNTKIPWYVIAAIDMREESFRHNAYLGNGDPLWRETTHVPAGRGPFTSWAKGAIDALTMRGFERLAPGHHWDIVTALMKLEEFNGLGYRARGIPSPYVWGLTTEQHAGKYTSDGHFDSAHWDTQPGCAALLLTLKTKFAVDLSEQ